MTISDQEFLEQLRDTFAMEAEEYLRSISNGLLDIERHDDPQRIRPVLEEVYRAAHSMKGAAQTVDMVGIGMLCHAMESVFLALKNGELTLRIQDYDVLQKAVDSISELLASPQELCSTADAELLGALDRIVTQGVECSGPREAPEFDPGAPESGNASALLSADQPVPGPKGARGRTGFAPAAVDQPGASSRDAAEDPLEGRTGMREVGTESGNAQVLAASPAAGNEPGQPRGNEPGDEADHLVDVADDAGSDAANDMTSDLTGCGPEGAPQNGLAGGGLDAGSAGGAGECIRIPATRLDAILLQSEELLAIKLAMDQRAGELSEVLGQFGPWKAQWSKFLNRGRSGASPPSADNALPGLDWSYSKLQHLEQELEAMHAALVADTHAAGLLINGLLDGTKSLLMLPASTLLTALPRMVRNVARERDKEAVFSHSGAHIEVDKRILERIKDPLIHLVRNCIDHGLETPDERQARGKPATGTISIHFSQIQGNKLCVEVADDGRGIDAAQVAESALKKGVISPDQARSMDEQAQLGLIFQSGVSTSRIITDISGRGLGMAIVREAVEHLGGNISILSTPGAGVLFRIILPVNVATFRGLLAREFGQTFAVPAANVLCVLRIPLQQVFTVEGRESIALRGAPVTLVRLGNVLEMTEPEASPAEVDAWGQGGAHSNADLLVMVLQSGNERMAFAAEAILGEQEMLIKHLGRQLVRVRNVFGATVLGSGQVVPVLNAADLLRSAAASTHGRFFSGAKTSQRSDLPRVLVAEDSITSRTLLKNILSAAGYEVRVAVDGAAAWEQLRKWRADVVVSDVEMPEMNGFELTAAIRGNKHTADIPVVLVTSLESQQDKERGIDVGADAYLVKSSFDQSNLLDILRRLTR